jgi:hypothetical protein
MLAMAQIRLIERPTEEWLLNDEFEKKRGDRDPMRVSTIAWRKAKKNSVRTVGPRV